MPTLNIEGKRVKVDDSFLSLTPEQQNATVEEIAQSIGGGNRTNAEMGDFMSGVNEQFTASKHDQDTRVRANLEATKLGELRGDGALGASAAKMVPFSDELWSATVGGGMRMLRDGVGYGEAYEREQALMEEMDRRRREKHPVASTVGDIAGGVAVAGSLPSLTAKAAGGGLLTRTLAGAAEGAGYGAVYGTDDAGMGNRASGALAGGIAGATFGGAIPLAGAALRKGYGAVRSAVNPAKEASARVRDAMARDAGHVAVSPADEAAARLNDQPLMNVDRGGETTRALARASANASPEARAAFDRAVNDRYVAQSDRTVDMIRRITGGATDDLALQDSIRSAARIGNKKAYDAALKSPRAQQVFTPKLQELLQSDAIRKAARKVPSTSSNRSLQNIANPFEVNSKGQYVLRRRADGTMVAPNLGFWDMVKRNLDDQIGVAQRAGQRSSAADLVALKKQLVDELDNVVPAYKAARAGAAAAFGAEDAIEAGKNFARTTRNTPEMKRALSGMSSAEKKAFQTGYASEMIDKIKSTRDRANVVDSMFRKPEAREKLLAAFGPAKAREIEAFVRIEGGMDLMRGALGNSTTARQLVELGLIGGGGGYGYMTGDWENASKAMAAGAVLGGVRYGRAKVDQRVLQKIAELLISGDEKAIQRVVSNSGASAKYLDALRAITDGLYKSSGQASGISAGHLVNQ